MAFAGQNIELIVEEAKEIANKVVWQEGKVQCWHQIGVKDGDVHWLSLQQGTREDKKVGC